MSEESIIVVGGGIAGLTGAALLSKEGYQVTLVEAHSQLGGCAGTFKRGSYTFDVGATQVAGLERGGCLLYTSPSRRDLSTARMPSSA